MIRSKSIAELYNEEQREQLCKWCRKTGRSDCSRCALAKTVTYENELYNTELTGWRKEHKSTTAECS